MKRETQLPNASCMKAWPNPKDGQDSSLSHLNEQSELGTESGEMSSFGRGGGGGGGTYNGSTLYYNRFKPTLQRRFPSPYLAM